MLLRYNGDRSTEHFGPNGPPHTAQRYGADNSGKKTYAFNSLGYRGEEFDRAAEFRIFVCGDGDGIGTGLDWEETWGYRLKCMLARRVDLDLSSVNLLNFSQSFASADYVTRTLISQCGAVKPDLVVAHYPESTRAEYFTVGKPQGVIPVPLSRFRRRWALRPGWRRRLAKWMPSLRNKKEARRILEEWEHYGKLFNAETGFTRTLTSMLLLQEFCRARRIEYLISWTEHRKLFDARFAKNNAITPLIALLDWERFCPFSLADGELKLDFAADADYPGPRSSKLFAERIADLYLKNTAHAPSPDRGASPLRAAS